MNARTVIEIRKALNYISIGICLGIFITLSIHFGVTQVMAHIQRADSENKNQAVYDKLMESLPTELIKNEHGKEVK